MADKADRVRLYKVAAQALRESGEVAGEGFILRLAEITVDAVMDGEVFGSADNLAANVRSFLGSLNFMAPEMVETQAMIKLREPLDEYNIARHGEP
jgi:hypothetical protein